LATPALRLRGLRAGWDTPLLAIDDLQIPRGEKVFLQGPSGSGKSTLLNVLAGLLPAQQGLVEVAGEDLSQLSGRQLDRHRAEQLGIIFQQFNLLPYLSVTDNVQLASRLAPGRKARAVELHGSVAEAARALLVSLGLERYINKKVSDLSVGQQQRVAVARALLGSPSLILADEPTSALDTGARDRFIELLSEQLNLCDGSLLFVSHDLSLAEHFDRQLSLATLNQLVGGQEQ